MPELPEVETVRAGLSRVLPGKQITAVSFDTPKSFPNASSDVKQFLVGAQVIKIERRAKVILIELSTSYSLIIHLKMTGQLVYRNGEEHFGAGHPNDSLIGELPDKSTRVILSMNDARLYFNDQRKFGWVRLVPTSEIPNIDFFKKLGPEPLNSSFSPEDFRGQFRIRPNSTIKAALLDQSVIAGVGNIYADESLWGAKIHPATRVRDVSDKTFTLLYTELRKILQLSIAKGGSTDRNYVTIEGKSGSYLQFARVFRRESKPCPRCGTPIIKIRVAGRGTHLCPHCQKVPV